MISDEKNSKENLQNKLFKELIIKEILETNTESDFHEKLDEELITKLKKSGIILKISQQTLTNKEEFIYPWLKTRLFESIIVDIALEEYLNALLAYNGNNASADVEVPGLLGAFHLLTSASPLVLEAIDNLEKKKKIKLNKKQKEVLKTFLDPKKTYQIEKFNVNFIPYELEDLRSDISRFLIDKVAQQKFYTIKKNSMFSFDHLLIEGDPVESLPNITAEQIIIIANQFIKEGTLKLYFLKNGIIWEYRNKPPILISENTLYILPQINKKLGYNDYLAKKQASIISDYITTKLKDFDRTLDLGSCIICNRPAQKLAFHKNKAKIIPVCDNCFKLESELTAEIVIKNKSGD